MRLFEDVLRKLEYDGEMRPKFLLEDQPDPRLLLPDCTSSYCSQRMDLLRAMSKFGGRNSPPGGKNKPKDEGCLVEEKITRYFIDEFKCVPA